MIVITDGKRKIKLDEKKLKIIDDNYLIQSKYEFWQVELVIIYKNGIIKKIVKEFSGGGDVQEEYKNIKEDDNIILLKSSDYDKISYLMDKMNLDDSFRKNAVIDSVSTFFANDCYEYYILADMHFLDIESVFESVIPENFILYSSCGDITKYKKEIFEATRKKLNEIYNVNLDYLFDKRKKGFI